MAEEMASLSEEEYDYDNEVYRDTLIPKVRQNGPSDTLSFSISSDKSFVSMVMASCSRSGKLRHSMMRWCVIILRIDWNGLTQGCFFLGFMAGK